MSPSVGQSAHDQQLTQIATRVDVALAVRGPQPSGAGCASGWRAREAHERRIEPQTGTWPAAKPNRMEFVSVFVDP